MEYNKRIGDMENGDAVEGFLHTTFAYDPSMEEMNPVAEKFTKEWRKVHPDKDPNVNSALGYDCYVMVADAITRAGSAEPVIAMDRAENLVITGVGSGASGSGVGSSVGSGVGAGMPKRAVPHWISSTSPYMGIAPT